MSVTKQNKEKTHIRTPTNTREAYVFNPTLSKHAKTNSIFPKKKKKKIVHLYMISHIIKNRKKPEQKKKREKQQKTRQVKEKKKEILSIFSQSPLSLFPKYHVSMHGIFQLFHLSFTTYVLY